MAVKLNTKINQKRKTQNALHSHMLRSRIIDAFGLNFSSLEKSTKLLILFCALANLLNQADRVNISVAVISMSSQYGWEV
jgi:hypothetical protein